jgi:peptidoglycan/xylan/chitin deacetylase (PgdA/CDA1 family)
MNITRRTISELKWPGGAKVCVTPSIVFETWSKGVAPGTNAPGGFIGGGVTVSDVRDLRAEKMIEFGGNVGATRLSEVLEREGLRGSVLLNGRAVEEYPDVVREMAEAGHEMVGHSFAQDISTYRFATPEAERENIRKTTEIIRDVTGVTATGWISPRATPSEFTAELLMDEGYEWFGDYPDDELPYLLEADDGRVLVSVPYSATPGVNDYETGVIQGGFPSDYVEQFSRTLDYLREEYEVTGRVGMVRASVHAHVYGRAFGRWAFRDAMRYAKGFDDVWIATRGEIAKAVLEQAGARDKLGSAT